MKQDTIEKLREMASISVYLSNDNMQLLNKLIDLNNFYELKKQENTFKSRIDASMILSNLKSALNDAERKLESLKKVTQRWEIALNEDADAEVDGVIILAIEAQAASSRIAQGLIDDESDIELP